MTKIINFHQVSEEKILLFSHCVCEMFISVHLCVCEKFPSKWFSASAISNSYKEKFFLLYNMNHHQIDDFFFLLNMKQKLTTSNSSSMMWKKLCVLSLSFSRYAIITSCYSMHAYTYMFTNTVSSIKGIKFQCLNMYVHTIHLIPYCRCLFRYKSFGFIYTHRQPYTFRNLRLIAVDMFSMFCN